MLFSLQFDDFKVLYFLSIDGKTQQSLAGLPSLQSCCSGVHCQEMKLRIVLHFEYMTVSANEQIRRFFTEHRNEPRVVPAGIAADMRHEHIDFFYAETIEFRKRPADLPSVHISEHSTRQFEFTQAAKDVVASDVSGMPDLIDVFEMFQDAWVE